jgi:hypothetical protein
MDMFVHIKKGACCFFEGMFIKQISFYIIALIADANVQHILLAGDQSSQGRIKP